jgi:ABC-2 type transport system permease protein
MKVYLQTILSPVLSNLLYLAIFGLSLKRTVELGGGMTYMQFLIPGLIIMGIINNAFQNPSSSIVIMKYQGLISDLMSIPLKRSEIMLAIISSAVLRGFIVGAATLATGLIFVSFTNFNIFVILTASLLVALFFSFLGMIVGIWAEDFDKVAFILNFILMPLIFLGGVFYPITSLPSLFKTLSSFNPIVYMIDMLRYGFTGVNEFPVILSFLIVSVSVFILGLISYLMLKKGYHLQN